MYHSFHPEPIRQVGALSMEILKVQERQNFEKCKKLEVEFDTISYKEKKSGGAGASIREYRAV